jgi:hypothetical protein
VASLLLVFVLNEIKVALSTLCQNLFSYRMSKSEVEQAQIFLISQLALLLCLLQCKGLRNMTSI